MTALIKDLSLQTDPWTKKLELDSPEELKGMKQVIIPLSFWKKNQSSLKDRADLGVYLDSHDEVEDIGEDAHHFPVIVINFPRFADGRGYSLARLLRDRYSYKGEIRAVGDVLQDQLFYMNRCGFNAFEVRSDRDATQAINGLKAFTEVYQDAADLKRPLYRRR